MSLPGDNKKATGFPNPSTMAWIFVFKPPFVRPTALFSVCFPTVRAFMYFYTSRVITEIFSIRILTQFRKNTLQDSVIAPLSKAGIYALPGTITLWKLSPLPSAVIHPKHTVEHDPVVFSGASFLPRVFRRQQWLNTLPLFICNIVIFIIIHALILSNIHSLCNIYFSNKA